MNRKEPPEHQRSLHSDSDCRCGVTSHLRLLPPHLPTGRPRALAGIFEETFLPLLVPSVRCFAVTMRPHRLSEWICRTACPCLKTAPHASVTPSRPITLSCALHRIVSGPTVRSLGDPSAPRGPSPINQDWIPHKRGGQTIPWVHESQHLDIIFLLSKPMTTPDLISKAI